MYQIYHICNLRVKFVVCLSGHWDGVRVNIVVEVMPGRLSGIMKGNVEGMCMSNSVSVILK